MSFHFLFISFCRGLKFLLQRVLHLVGQVYFRYFIFFETIVDKSVPVISFSVCLLLVCRKASELDKLILYSDTLLFLFIVSTGRIWGSVMHSIMLSADRESLTSFPVCIPLISFSCLIVPASASDRMDVRS